jgi:hypothetical protein
LFLGWQNLSKTKFAVGTQTHQFERGGVGLAIDQDKIGPNVTVAVIAPFTGKRMVKISVGEGRVIDEQVDGFHKQRIESLAVLSGFLATVVPLETSSVFNLPH